jgi:hypothetical protein
MNKDVQVIRQPSFTGLYVDSMDRYAKGYPSDTSQLTSSSQWTLQSRQYVLNGYFHRLALTQIQFFYNLPTIITGYNDTVAIGSDDGTSLLGYITIPQGWYTCDTLASTLSTLFDVIVTGGTVAANPNTGALTFTAPTDFSILPPDSALVTSYSQVIAQTYQTTGIIPGGATGSYSISGTIPTMLPTRFVDVGSKYLTKSQRVKDASTLITGQTTNILCRVYIFPPFTRTPWPPTTNSGVDVDTPTCISLDFGSGKQLAWNEDEIISNFDIFLTDEYGSLLPWSPDYGCEYSFVLTASET